MSWENSKATTPLKRDFLKAFFANNPPFFLTGGSALGMFYLDHRKSYDLDLFTTDQSVDWHLLDTQVRQISKQLSCSLNAITTSPTFRRYQFTRGDEQEVIDFVLELVPQIDPEKTMIESICVDTLHEIFVNKVCTLISRCENKDLIDLYYLEQEGFVIEDALQEASEKEGGMDSAMIAYILSAITVDKIPEYLLKPLSLEKLNEFISSLQNRMAAAAFPTPTEPDL